MVYKNLVNTATFSSAAQEYRGADNVTVEIESNDYIFEKTADPVEWYGTGELAYTITLTRVSGPDLEDITVTDILPDGVELVDNSVIIDSVQSDNFDNSTPSTIVFGTTTPLTVTSVKPLVITFHVTKTP